MAFNGSEGSWITSTEGGDLTKNYRDSAPSGCKLAHFLGKDKLQDLLDVEGSMGIRFYYGINSEGKQQLVAVAADANENDIMSLILDAAIPCPSRCSNKNALNS